MYYENFTHYVYRWMEADKVLWLM